MRKAKSTPTPDLPVHADVQADAATLRGYINTYGETPTMTASSRDHWRARAERAEAALKGILRGFDEGAFVRDTSRDGDPSWAVRFLPHIQALALAQQAIQKAEAVR